MSLRRNILIAIAIIVLCTLLIAQMLRDQATYSSAGNISIERTPLSAETEGAESEQIVELTAAVVVNAEQYAQLTKRNEQLREDFPHIQVKLMPLDASEAYDYYKEQSRLGSAPDMMLLANEWVNEFAASGYLSHQLEQFIQVKNSNATELMSWNGYTWAVPYWEDPYVVAVNPTVEGLFLGDTLLPRSLEEWNMLRVIRSADGLTDGIIYYDPDDPYAFVSLILSLGGEWVREPGGMIQLSASQDRLLDLLFGASPEDDKNVPLYPLAVTEAYSPDELWSSFAEGKIPIVIARLSELQTRGFAEWQIPGLVEMEEPQYSLWRTGYSFAVASTSAYPEHAFRWLQALTEGGIGSSPSPQDKAFEADPDLMRKMKILQEVLEELYQKQIEPLEVNNRLSELWSARG